MKWSDVFFPSGIELKPQRGPAGLGGAINDVDHYTTYGRGDAWPPYSRWRALIDRVFSQKGYASVAVCDEWLLFSGFLSWLGNQPYNELFELDKDILGNGTVYCPNSCLLIPKWLNAESRGCNDDCKRELAPRVHIDSRMRPGTRRYYHKAQASVVGTFHTAQEAATSAMLHRLGELNALKDDMDCVDLRIFPTLEEKVKKVYKPYLLPECAIVI